MRLKVEYMSLGQLAPYAGNAKKHTEKQIEQLANSIDQFGFNDPIGVWTNPDGVLEIVEGHGRVMACKELGWDDDAKVPVIRLDHLDDEARRAYTHVHNQLTMNTGFDIEKLESEMKKLDFEWSDFGFNVKDVEQPDEKYTTATNIPQYEPETAEMPTFSEMVDTSKRDELIAEIEASDIDDDAKAFLEAAASRHCVFSYSKIADYYSQAPAKVQRLMERSALVIIDYDDAIANGYATLKGALERISVE